MNNISKHIYTLLVSLLFVASGLSAQTYYEIQYEQMGYTFSGLMIYKGDAEPTWLRFVQRDSEQEFIDIWTYTDMQMIYNDSDKNNVYSVLKNNDKYAIRLVCIWGKDGECDAYIIPSADEEKKRNEWIKCSYFAEAQLRDMDEEFCLRYLNPTKDSQMYNSIIKANKLVNESEKEVQNNLGNGFDIYRYFYEAKHTEMTASQISKELYNREVAFNKDVAVTHPQLAKRVGNRIKVPQGQVAQNTAGGQKPQSINNTKTNNSSASSQVSLDNSTIHLMIVANSEVADIGATCKIDLANMQNEIQGIGQAIGVPVQQYLVTGKDYSIDGVVAKLEEMNPTPNDIVVFLYTGHGFRFSDQKDKYPNMAMTTSSYQNVSENYIALSDIYDAICSKGARLNIVLSDCCNADLGDRRPVKSNSLGSRGNNNFSIDRLKKLFSAKGSLISTAASPNEVSWCDNAGGMFTLSFIQSLRKEISATNTKEVSWDNVISNTLISASKRSKSICKSAQNGLKYVKMVK